MVDATNSRKVGSKNKISVDVTTEFSTKIPTVISLFC